VGGAAVSMRWKWWGVADRVDSARSRGDRGPVAVEARAGDGAGGASRGSSESERERADMGAHDNNAGWCGG
jgi:hypothetical protein